MSRSEGLEVPTSESASEPPPPRLLRRWDLDESCALLPQGELSWRVEPGPYRLREFTGADRRQVLFRHEVMAALSATGLPVPAAIPARGGRTLVTVAGRRFALYPGGDGRPREGLELSLTQCRELGTLLGQLHAGLETLTPPVQQTLLVPAARAADALAEVDTLLAGLSADSDTKSHIDTDCHTDSERSNDSEHNDAVHSESHNGAVNSDSYLGADHSDSHSNGRSGGDREQSDGEQSDGDGDQKDHEARLKSSDSGERGAQGARQQAANGRERAARDAERDGTNGLRRGRQGRAQRDSFDALAERRLRERRALLTEFADHQPPEVEAVAVGYVHGDFQARNLRYGLTRKVTAVVGWENLRIAPIAGELVSAAVSLFARPDGELDLDRVAAFADGHAEAFPLDPAQVGSAVHRLWWERLCDLGPLRRQYVERDRGDRTDPGAPALVTWWTTNLDRTLEIFAAPYAPRTAEEPLDALL